MKTTDFLLLSHIAYTTQCIGPTRKASNVPSILRSIAIIVLAAVILIVGLR